MKKSFLFLVFCFWVFHSKAQTKFFEIPLPIENPSEAEQVIFGLKKQTNLNDLKGYKWILRHFEGQSRNIVLGSKFPNQDILLEEAIKVSKQKALQNHRSNIWSPAGPDVRPPGTNAYLNHGMGRINCIEFHPTDKNTFWVGVAQGGVWKTTNGGQSYTPLTDNLPILRISDIAVNPNNTDEIYICVGDYAYIGVALDFDDRKRNTHYGLGVYKTIDGGLNWTETGLNFTQLQRDFSLMRRVIIHPNQPQNLIAVGASGVFASSDAGVSWTKQLDSLMWDVEQNKLNPNVLYASSGYVKNINKGFAAVYKSVNFGQTWTKLPTGIEVRDSVLRVEITISQADTNFIYAVGCDVNRGFYGFYQSTDAGKTWTKTFSKTQNKNILAWSDGIDEIGGQGVYDLCLITDAVDPQKVFVGGVNLWGSSNGGQDFDGVSYWVNYFGESLHADLHQMRYNPLDSSFYVCHDGGLSRTKNIEIGSWDDANNVTGYLWPTQWEDLSSGMQITSFYRLGLSANNSGNIIAGAQDNSTFYKKTGNWRNVFGGDGMEAALDPLDTNKIYGSSQYGRIYKSNNAGKNYDYYFSYDMWATEEAEWTTPFLINPKNNNHLIAGYSNVWETLNSNQWFPISNFQGLPELNGNAPPASALAFSETTSKFIYVAKRPIHSLNEKSKVLMTKNGGQLWTDITAGLPDSLYFTYITLDDNNPENVWISCAGFANNQKVFYSNNAGLNWQNISQNLPNVPVNCVLLDQKSANNTLYAATDVGLYYTNDTTNQWHPYFLGLPNVIVSEIEIHDEDRQLFAATFGRGIWVADLLDEPAEDTTIFIGVKPRKPNAFGYNLSPNPTNGKFTVDVNNEMQFEGTINAQMVDVFGKTVYQKSFNSENNNQFYFDVNLASGKYFIRLTESNGRNFWVIPVIIE